MNLKDYDCFISLVLPYKCIANILKIQDYYKNFGFDSENLIRNSENNTETFITL